MVICMPNTAEEIPFVERVNRLRDDIKTLNSNLINLKKRSFFNGDENPSQHDRKEMKANIMLAYRHLEDARMRLGKVIQAHDGGKSVYDKVCIR